MLVQKDAKENHAGKRGCQPKNILAKKKMLANKDLAKKDIDKEKCQQKKMLAKKRFR